MGLINDQSINQLNCLGGHSVSRLQNKELEARLRNSKRSLHILDMFTQKNRFIHLKNNI